MSDERVCSQCVYLGFPPANGALHQTVAQCEKLRGDACPYPGEHHKPEWHKRHRVISLCADCGAQVGEFDYGECKA